MVRSALVYRVEKDMAEWQEEFLLNIHPGCTESSGKHICFPGRTWGDQ